MAFVSSGLQKIADLGFPTTSGGTLWLYTSTDPHLTVEGLNYFSGAGYGSKSTNAQGMRQGDIVIVKNFSTAGTSACTLHAVSSISTSSGAFNSPIHATISAAGST